MNMLQRTGKTLLMILLILLPLFFFPFIRDYYDMGKWILFVFIALMILIAWSIKLFLQKNARISWSGTTVAVGLLSAGSFLSLTFSSTNKLEALTTPLGPLLFLSATIILFFGPSLFSSREKIFLRLGLALAAGLAGLLSLYQFMGLGTMLFSSNSPFADRFFTPLGSPVALLTFLVLTLPITLSITVHAIKERKDVVSGFSLVGLIFTLVGIGVTFWNFFPRISSVILPLPLGFVITRAAWNDMAHIFLGVGPENFFRTFTLLRPQTLNMTPLWNTGFTANASLVFHIATTMGVMGVLALAMFLFELVRECGSHPILRMQAILAIIIALLFPPSLILILLLVLILLSSDTDTDIPITIHGVSKYIIVLITFLLSLFACYGLFRFTRSEMYFYQGLTLALTGNGTGAYTFEKKAVDTNPMNMSFHIGLSQTSLLLTEGIIQAAPIESDGTQMLTGEDKKLIQSLIATSIKEAKLAVVLNPNDVLSWINLARTYQGIIGVAAEADTWAIASYQKAISLDPTNPVLRVDLGGLYMMLERQDEAGQEFLTAITLKPNYINGFYNLANAFREKGDYDNAVKALEQTRRLIAKGSRDEETIDTEIIAILEEKRAKGQTKTPSSLSVPLLKMPQD